MDYESKLKLAHAEASLKGVWQSNSNPPIFQLLKKMGFRVPPPYYQSVKLNFIISFGYFTPIFGLINGLVSGQPVSIVINTAVSAGLIFAVFTSSFYYVRQKQLNLTRWNDLKDIAE